MEDKDKQQFNYDEKNGVDSHPSYDEQDEQSAYQTKRHYFGFGDKVNGNGQHLDATKKYDTAEIIKQNPIVSATYTQHEQYNGAQDETISTTAIRENELEQVDTAKPLLLNRVEQASTNQQFRVNEKKSNKGKAVTQYFLMFIASVLVVAAVMFIADKYNLFTGNSTASTTQSSSGASAEKQTSPSYLEDRPENISELFKAASPAVVKIETYTEVSYNNSNSLFNDPFFRQFFGDSYAPQQQENQNKSELQQSGMGTGFFFDEEGYILTNQHVIADAKEIRVIVEGYDEPFTAELLGSSYDLDLAVLKLNADDKFPTLEIGSSDDVTIGDWVVAIGNPYGFDHTLTVGVISAKERPISISDTDGQRNYENLLQTDASINPGNSGGPLLNLNGQVIGINTAVSSQAQGIGFAIPTSTITEVLDYLIENKEIPKDPIPFLGVSMSQATEEMLKGTGVSKAIRVENIVYGSPAYTGGLNQYDIITKVDDTEITTPEQLQTYIKSKQVGDTVKLHVIRRGEEKVIEIELGDGNNFTTQK